MSRSAIERRLRNLTQELSQLRSELNILDEQILHFQDSADEARMRSMVSETPQAGAAYKDARRTLEVMQKNRAEVQAKVASIELKQDALLDALGDYK